MTAYVNVADFKLGCQKVGLLTASATSVCLQGCASAPILTAPWAVAGSVDSHHDLRHFLSWLLPALLQETAAHPLGTVGQKVHPGLICPVAEWCKPLLSTMWMQNLGH